MPGSKAYAQTCCRYGCVVVDYLQAHPQSLHGSLAVGCWSTHRGNILRDFHVPLRHDSTMRKYCSQTRQQDHTVRAGTNALSLPTYGWSLVKGRRTNGAAASLHRFHLSECRADRSSPRGTTCKSWSRRAALITTFDLPASG